MLLKVNVPETGMTGADTLEIVRTGYERCHPDDTFADLVRRSRFSKQDRRLLQDWVASSDREFVRHG